MCEEILKIDKLSYYFPRINQKIIDDYDINEIKEGVIVKYRAGECKCIVTQVSTDMITINDNSHCSGAERKIKASEIKQKLQIVKFLNIRDRSLSYFITSSRDVEQGDILIDRDGMIWQIGLLIDERLQDKNHKIGSAYLNSQKGEFKYILEEELVQCYRKLATVEYL